MKAPRGKDAVACVALLGATLLGGWMFLRPRLALFASWTDGQRDFASETGAGIRHAVWERPEPVAGGGEPTLSPDGRRLSRGRSAA